MTPTSLFPAESFLLHDVGDFPLVRMNGAHVRPGYAFSWGTEMQRLLAADEPFVLIHDSALERELPDDRRLREIWLRRHQLAVRARCRGLIVLQPEVAKRTATRLAARALSAGSGLRVMVVSSAQVAAELVPILLKVSGVGASEPALEAVELAAGLGTGRAIFPARK